MSPRGSNLLAQIGVESELDESTGISLNTKEVKKLWNDAVEQHDHHVWMTRDATRLDPLPLDLNFAWAMHSVLRERASVAFGGSPGVMLRLIPLEKVLLEIDVQGVAYLSIIICRSDIGSVVSRMLLMPNIGNYQHDDFLMGNGELAWYLDAPAMPGVVSQPGVCFRFKIGNESWATNNCRHYDFKELLRAAIKATAETLSTIESLQHFQNTFMGLQFGHKPVFELDRVSLVCPGSLALHFSAESVVHVAFRFGFDATHDLRLGGASDARNREAFGPCSEFPQHGHRWGVYSEHRVSSDGFRIQSEALSIFQVLNELLGRLNGSHLNDIISSRNGTPPTSERLLQWIKEAIARSDVHTSGILIQETPKNAFAASWQHCKHC